MPQSSSSPGYPQTSHLKNDSARLSYLVTFGIVKTMNGRCFKIYIYILPWLLDNDTSN